MKSLYAIFLCFFLQLSAYAKQLPDSVLKIIENAGTDGDKGRAMITYFDYNTANENLLKEQVVLKKYFEGRKDKVMTDYVQLGICRQMTRTADVSEAINELFQLISGFQARGDEYGVMVCHRHLSYAFWNAGDSAKTIFYDRKALEMSLVSKNKYDVATAYNNMAADLAEYGQVAEAVGHAKKAVTYAKAIQNPLIEAKTLFTLGEVFMAKEQYDSAIFYLRQALPIAKIYSPLEQCFTLNDFAQIYLQNGVFDSAVIYARQAANASGIIYSKGQLLRAYQYLIAAYKKTGPSDSAYKYLELSLNAKDSLYKAEKVKHLELIDIREQNRQRELEQIQKEQANKIKVYALISGLIIFTIIALLLYRNISKEKKAKILLQNKNKVIEQTLAELKATQAQLIQSEKMASLGELTAGIAHEIQNPLNFVNNFSDVNKELLEELKEEAEQGNLEEVKAIAVDVIGNEEKINHHGKRADAIVKGMLQHSRSSSGQKEQTDINELADEYLRLAYHGLRAKDKSFNATLKTDYDESIGSVNIVPQDIGRVILNLITNAFHAVDEKNKQTPDNYKPTVSVSTKKIDDRIEIRVSDNGNGIPQNIIDKIFQPFFTTKPTGQGTGLGLSLAYDIVKAHGGELNVRTKQDEGCEFIIHLPHSFS